MPTPSRIRAARFTCDMIAIGVGYFCLIGLLGEHEFSGWTILLTLMPLCGAVAGLGFGFTQTTKSRLVLGAFILAMCTANIAAQARAYVLGSHNLLSVEFFVCYSLPCILLLLCLLADRSIGRRISGDKSLPLTLCLSRMLLGGAGFFHISCVSMNLYLFSLATSPTHLMAQIFHLIYIVCWTGLFVLSFWYLTCPDAQRVQTFSRSLFKSRKSISDDDLFRWIIKFGCSAFACSALAWFGDTMLAIQSMASITAIVVLSIISISSIARYESVSAPSS